MFDRLEDRACARTRRAVEELRMDGEAARLSQRDPVCGAYVELLSASEGANEAFGGLARSAIVAPTRSS
jgi:hypothetical protein